LKGETEVALRKEREKHDYQVLLVSNLEEINRMSCIIDDLLLLSKADMKEIKLNVEEVALRDLIMDVCMDMKVVADKKNIELELSELADIRLRGDELKLRRMLLNIVENGIKYSHVGGKVSVSAYVNDGYAKIDVKDNGIGISEEDIKYIFDRFYRLIDREKGRAAVDLVCLLAGIAEAHKCGIECREPTHPGEYAFHKIACYLGEHMKTTQGILQFLRSLLW
jgi:signal transduction histidine kinase